MSDGENLGFRTLSEVKDAAIRIERIANRAEIKMAGGKHGRKAATQAAAISALILWLEHQTQGQIEAVLRDGMARLNAYLESTDQPARHDAVDRSVPIVPPPPPSEAAKTPRKGRA